MAHFWSFCLSQRRQEMQSFTAVYTAAYWVFPVVDQSVSTSRRGRVCGWSEFIMPTSIQCRLSHHTPAGSADFCLLQFEQAEDKSNNREEVQNIHHFIVSYSKTTFGSCRSFLHLTLRFLCVQFVGFFSPFCAPWPVSRPPLVLHPSHTDTLIGTE